MAELYNEYGVLNWSDARVEAIEIKVRQLADLIETLADTLPPIEDRALWQDFIASLYCYEASHQIRRGSIAARKKERGVK